jgi:hypothetical protein
MAASTHYVYLKLQSYAGNIEQNTIPLRATGVSVSVSKTIPAFPVPLSGIATGESITAALDLGMATKNITINGFIVDDTITKVFDGTVTSRKFTAHEIAQMIASGVDSTGLAKNQAFSELIVLMPSFVASDYNYRGTCSIATHKNKTDCEAAGGTWTQTITDNSEREDGINVPLMFGSRGNALSLDNARVPLPLTSFPDSNTDTGITGFVRSFGYEMNADAYEISFTLEFESANIFP